MTLEESAHEDTDQVEEIEGIRFLYEKKIVEHVNGKIIDYQMAPHEGFAIISDGPDPCGGCSCD